MDGIVEAAPGFTREQAIEQLGEGVRKTSMPSIYSIEEARGVNAKLKQVLISIPGHAKYFQDKIESMRADVLANAKKSEEELNELYGVVKVMDEESYGRYCSMIAFPTLGGLPSPETVAVLGHFLNDPEGRDGKNILGYPVEMGEAGRATVNAEEAVKAIRRLGIEKPPIRSRENNHLDAVFEGEIDAWKDWWNEVKAGKRTYRFIGSDVEYGPDGPVAGSPSSCPRDPAPRSPAAAQTPESAKPQPRWPLLVAGAVLLLAALRYFLKKRKAT